MGQTRNLLYASAYRGFDKFAGSEFGQRNVSGAGPEGANYTDVVCSPTLSVIFKYKSLIIMTNFEICDIGCHFTYHFMWLMEISKRQVAQVTGRGSPTTETTNLSGTDL